MRSWRLIPGTLVDPLGTFRALAEAPRSLLVIAILIAANLSVPLALSGKISARPQVLASLGPKLADMTDREIDEAVTQKEKLVEFASVARAVVSPALLALELALALWLWARYLGARPAFGTLYSMSAHAQLPLALRSLASAVVIFSRPAIAPEEIGGLLPSNPASLLHGHAALARALGGADLFLVWTAVLLGLALHASGNLSPRRAALGMAIGYAAFVSVVLVGLPGLGGA